MENKQLFETLKAGLGNGLKFQIEGDPVDDIQGLSTDVEEIYGNDGFGYSIELCKPHLFPLSMLTKPIRIEGYIEGGNFVAIEHIATSLDHKDHMIRLLEKGQFNCYNLKGWQKKKLEGWHFNTEELDEDQYINAAESKVYEPK